MPKILVNFKRNKDGSFKILDESVVFADMPIAIKEFDEVFAQQLLKAHDEIFRNYRLMSLLDFEGKNYITEGTKRWQ